jgi:hypothetical protein
VVEVFALQDDARAAGVLGEPRYLGDDRGAARVGLVQRRQFGGELGVGLGEFVRRAQFVEGRDEGFGNEASAELAEVGADLGIL